MKADSLQAFKPSSNLEVAVSPACGAGGLRRPSCESDSGESPAESESPRENEYVPELVSPSRNHPSHVMFSLAPFARSIRISAPRLVRSFSAAAPFITLDESTQTLSALTSANPRVLAYFTATWCGPCRAIAPKFAALAGAHASVKFVKIDVDDNADTMSEVRQRRRCGLRRVMLLLCGKITSPPFPL